jgi:hypothetical protein
MTKAALVVQPQADNAVALTVVAVPPLIKAAVVVVVGTTATKYAG